MGKDVGDGAEEEGAGHSAIMADPAVLTEERRLREKKRAKKELQKASQQTSMYRFK